MMSEINSKQVDNHQNENESSEEENKKKTEENIFQFQNVLNEL